MYVYQQVCVQYWWSLFFRGWGGSLAMHWLSTTGELPSLHSLVCLCPIACLSPIPLTTPASSFSYCRQYSALEEKPQGWFGAISHMVRVGWGGDGARGRAKSMCLVHLPACVQHGCTIYTTHCITMYIVCSTVYTAT